MLSHSHATPQQQGAILGFLAKASLAQAEKESNVRPKVKLLSLVRELFNSIPEMPTGRTKFNYDAHDGWH